MRKINALIWFRKRKKSLQGAEDAQSSEPQKAHLTNEFVVVTNNGGHALLCLGLYACDCGQ